VSSVHRGSMPLTRAASRLKSASAAGPSDQRSAAIPTASVGVRPRIPQPDGVGPVLPEASGTAPAFVPFQLTDEMYAQIYRDPGAWGYPTIKAGAVQKPKFGYIYVEMRQPGSRRPKLTDGFDWVPSSSANASVRPLAKPGESLVRNYCARRTRSADAKPQVRPFLIFQRERYDALKQEHPSSTTYELKALLGSTWRAMSDAQKRPYQEGAQRENRQLRSVLSRADPAQLLVRHEMWLRRTGDASFEDSSPGILIHYLGEGAYQNLETPPRPIRVASYLRTTTDDGADADGGTQPQTGAFTDELPDGVQVDSVQLALHCCCSIQKPRQQSHQSDEDVSDQATTSTSPDECDADYLDRLLGASVNLEIGGKPDGCSHADPLADDEELLILASLVPDDALGPT